MYNLYIDATVVLARYVLTLSVCQCVWQGTDYKLPKDDTIVSKHVGV